MPLTGLEAQIQEVRTRDPRYKKEAYFFVLEALDFTLAKLERYDQEGEHRHVSGRELLYGIREYGLSRFGPLAGMVFRRWGVTKTGDFGEIVFNLVDCGLLHSRPEDSKDDFQDVYDFEEAFDTGLAVRLALLDPEEEW